MACPLPRWSRVVAVVYLGLVSIFGVLAVQRLAVSPEMPGLAAWELLVLALPWTLVLETPLGRQLGGFSFAAVLLAGIAMNAGLLYAIGAALERLRRAA
jgi:hypothetical protein